MSDDSGGFSPPSWWGRAAAFFTAGSIGAAMTLVQDGPNAFFREHLLPFLSETVVGWIIGAITSVFAELARTASLIGGSIREGIVDPFSEIGSATQAAVESWVAWQTSLLETAALEFGLAGPFVSLAALGIVAVANVAIASLVWDIANDYIPLQVVSEPFWGAIETVQTNLEAVGERLTPPYGGSTDE